MTLAVYARVSTQMQAEQQTIEQQITRLRQQVEQEGLNWEQVQVFRDEGYSGGRVNRPGLNRLRGLVRQGEISRVLVTAPDRLARRYVDQVLVLDEFKQFACSVCFLERPMSDDPNDQLLLQIRGAVAEYERALIGERMRRGREMKYRAGLLVPWTIPPYGLRGRADNPRDPKNIYIEEAEANQVREMFTWYSHPGRTLYGLAEYLHDQGILNPKGQAYWNKSTIQHMLRNPVYTGKVYAGRMRQHPTQRRRSALDTGIPMAQCHKRTSPDEWFLVATIPAIISQELFDQVQAKLEKNREMSRRNNKSHDYLLRALVSCGQCRLGCVGRSADPTHAYYYCGGKARPHQTGHLERCPARAISVAQLDDLVWGDVCQLVAEPELVAAALERAQRGEWLPQELQSRRQNLRKSQQHLQNQQERLTEAYLNGVIPLPEYQQRRQKIEQQIQSSQLEGHKLQAQVIQQDELAAMTRSLTQFCQQIQQGLDGATFEQKRQIVELLIDRVVVTGDQVEIRYVIPTSPDSYHTRFCHLRSNYCS
jgi:site-specific DNA recombinase